MNAPPSIPPPPVRTSLRAIVGGPLDDGLDAAFAAELVDTNRRRLRVVLPLMMVGHLIHALWFWVSADERASLEPRIALWRDGIAITHLATFAVVALVAVAVFRAKDRMSSLVGPLAAVIFLWHGAAIASIDQLTVTGVTPFIGYCLGIAVLTALTPRSAIAVYALGLVAFILGLMAMQPSASARMSLMPNGISISAISIALAWLLYLGRRRDFVQRVTIETQRAELAALNQGLETRVAEQVAEIMQRAEEVEHLNAQLQAQVRERSNELSLALERLAARRESDVRLRRGTVLAERFEVDKVIGEGGMGAVYSGVDLQNRGRVAIKVIQASWPAKQLESLHRFLREARMAATVTHPGIVRMLHVDVSDDGVLFQVQELVDGESLQSCLREGRRWDPALTARLIAALSDALAAAHEKGIVHRDVKAANVMLTRTAPGVKLLDFGISKLQEEAREDSQTQTGTFLGTPAYMGPEQLHGSRDVNDRADVYAVGVLMFLLLTGRYPFEQLSFAGAILERQRGDAPSVRLLVPSAPEPLCDAVASCLRREPSERPSARALCATLSAFCDVQGTPSLIELERLGRVRDLDTPAPVEYPTVRSAPPRVR